MSHARFHDIAWVQPKDGHSKGVIAGALENGSLDLWDAEKLLTKDDGAHLSRTSKHSAAIKSLQFNPFRTELLATAGAKGELYISDLNNIANPFRLGNTAARADDFECLDWNKKVPHIMVTGSSGGFVTVWDVKAKKESLTLNNSGRKPVSAVAWDPEKPTRLITAVPLDTDPLILVWDLRNSNAPEKVLRGHEGGVLSLSWCQQDSDLLLSCGKDNRTICWNPQTGESYGDFPVVTNWTFQTRWNPHNPSLLATASFDGKLAVQTIQNTKSQGTQSTGAPSHSLDGEDFFDKAQSEPQTASFTLLKAPKWLERPCGVSFGFGGKVISFSRVEETRQSKIDISTFAVDDTVGTLTDSFEKAMNEFDLTSICESRIAEATLEAEKNDWKVIETLISNNPRKELISYLGFSSTTEDEKKPATNGSDGLQTPSQVNGTSEAKNNRLSSFFEGGNDGDNFLADLAATKGAKINNPFHIYSGSESEPDRTITQALMLGQFEKALGVCLDEDRLSDAFMIAICGGQTCIDQVQKAYFSKQAKGPQYLRLLASVVGKNLWDIVYNADLGNWKEVMATLCTYASAEEFPDLCETLGDRLEEQLRDDPKDMGLRKDASFCYLAGSKLEKVVDIWIEDLKTKENAGLQDSASETSFSIHARSLQNFIEKVTVFRAVTNYKDDHNSSESGWKLSPLYEKYNEYADIVAAHGKLDVAAKYLAFLPDKYPAAEVARNRVRQATRKEPAKPITRQPATTARTPQMPTNTVPNTGQPQRQSTVDAMRAQAYAPSGLNQPQNPYAPQNSGSQGPYGAPVGYQPQAQQQFPRQQQPAAYGAPSQPQGFAPASSYGAPPQQLGLGPPPRNMNASPSIPPPSKAQNMTNWNDTPEDFFKPPTSRRGTPAMNAPPPVNAPFPNAPSMPSTPGLGYGAPKQTPPPPPKGSSLPRVSSPHSINGPQSYQQPERPSSSAANQYAPSQQSQPSPGMQQPSLPRGSSPYNAPPSAPPPSNRYAPAPSTQSAAPPPGSSQQMPMRPPPANPYAPQQSFSNQRSNVPNQQQQQYQQPPPPQSRAVLPPGPPPPQAQSSRPSTATSQPPKPAKAAPTKYRMLTGH